MVCDDIARTVSYNKMFCGLVCYVMLCYDMTSSCVPLGREKEKRKEGTRERRKG